MLKKLSVVICVLGVALATAGAASAQSATQEAKGTSKAAAHKSAAVLSDAEITSAVKTKLLADKTVGGLKIDVDTTDGVVTLTGPVATAAEHSQALRIARNTKGVKHVTDKLTVEAGATTGKVLKDDASDKSDEAKDETKSAAKKTTDATKHAAKKTGDATEHAAKAT